MTAGQAREAARRWIAEEARGIAGFCGAYTAGSTNWLDDDAEMSVTSDVDVMVLVDDGMAAGRRKFRYGGALLEVTYLRKEQFALSEQVLRDYRVAPGFQTAKVLVDPSGELTRLRAEVSPNFAKWRWVRERCAHARREVAGKLESAENAAVQEDQAMACLFAAGITTHILLTSGMKNPTVRTRYVALRELLAEYGCGDFHEALLELLGAARIDGERARRRLAALVRAFDAAKDAMKTAFVFSADISDCCRANAIDGSAEMIERGLHREAMFWIGVTHCRCRKILVRDAPGEVARKFEDGFRELIGDLGLADGVAVRRRCADIERMLPRVWDVAEKIMEWNGEIERE